MAQDHLKSWFRLADDFASSHRLASCTPIACWLYVNGLATAHQLNADGLIPFSSVRQLIARAKTTKRRFDKSVGELEAAGLWEPCAEGWNIHHYLQCQESKAERAAARQAATERQRRYRQSRNGVTPESLVTCDSRVISSAGDALVTQPDTDTDTDTDKYLVLSRRQGSSRPEREAVDDDDHPYIELAQQVARQRAQARVEVGGIKDPEGYTRRAVLRADEWMTRIADLTKQGHTADQILDQLAPPIAATAAAARKRRKVER